MIVKKSRGAISTAFLILGVILLVLIIIIFVVLKISSTKNTANQADTNASLEPVGPVYEKQLGDVNFTFASAVDIGSVIASKNPQYQPNLVSTERFIKVIIGAQNKGKLNIKKYSWDIGNIVDSEGRNFVPILQDYQSLYVINSSNLCGELLKPEFEPTPCVRYYEVSKKSTGLKVEVYTRPDPSSNRKDPGLIDLTVN